MLLPAACFWEEQHRFLARGCLSACPAHFRHLLGKKEEQIS